MPHAYDINLSLHINYPQDCNIYDIFSYMIYFHIYIPKTTTLHFTHDFILSHDLRKVHSKVLHGEREWPFGWFQARTCHGHQVRRWGVFVAAPKKNNSGLGVVAAEAVGFSEFMLLNAPKQWNPLTFQLRIQELILDLCCLIWILGPKLIGWIGERWLRIRVLSFSNASTDF